MAITKPCDLVALNTILMINCDEVKKVASCHIFFLVTARLFSVRVYSLLLNHNVV
jgi:hypothetical protein